MRFSQRMIVAALLSTLGLAAQAAPSIAQLRVMGIDVSRGPSSYEGRDRFSNGAPLNGMVYTNNATHAQLTGGYNASSLSAGSELSGPDSDFVGSALGVGRLDFRIEDAVVSNSNLTPAGYNSKFLQLRLQFLDPRPPESVPGASFEGLLLKSNGFDTFTAWNFLMPSPGASYGMRIDGGPANDGSFNDRIDVRVVTSLLGVTRVNFERTTSNALGIRTRTLLGSVAFADVYAGDLADVDYIVLGLQRDTPTPGGNTLVSAGLELLDASMDAHGDLNVLGTFDFTLNRPVIFSDKDNAQLSALATWLEPTVAAVPEPGTYALMLAGLGVLAGVARRRRS